MGWDQLTRDPELERCDEEDVTGEKCKHIYSNPRNVFSIVSEGVDAVHFSHEQEEGAEEDRTEAGRDSMKVVQHSLFGPVLCFFLSFLKKFK